MTHDMYAGTSETTEGRVFTVTGQDWDSIVSGLAEDADERVVVNMGPQHPSTHGVLRLILELEGETVTEARCGIGYLHTGIEKNMEYRSWVQGVTFCTRMDYLSPFYNEATYCLGVERLLDIEDDIPEKASVMRVLLMELNRISSHLVCIATGRHGDRRADRHDHRLPRARAGPRPVRADHRAADEPRLHPSRRRRAGPAARRARRDPRLRRADEEAAAGVRRALQRQPDLQGPPRGRRPPRADGVLALGITGPVLRSTGYPWDLRKSEPYCGYEDYDFEVQTWDTCDSYGRFRIRLNEMWESLKIIEQAANRLAGLEGAPVMVGDKKIAWPSQLAIGSDGMGNSLDHIRHIMGESMEALIHHFKIVTEGFRVPAGQAYVPIESPRGELGAHVVSDGGTKPVPGPLPRPVVHQPPGHRRDERGRHGRRRHRRDRLHRPGDGRGRPVTATSLDSSVLDELRAIAARYPEPRSGLLPMLHLVQSVEGRVTPEGIQACADILDLSAAEVSGVATFYTMYKRKPVGDYLVGVCTNTLCAVMGGDAIFERLKDHLDVGNDETTADGKVTLEHVECNAACDYAPVMMVNWEFMDNMTPSSAVQLVDDLREGKEVTSTRGPRICTWREAERVLAGFPDGRVDEGPAAGGPSLVGSADRPRERLDGCTRRPTHRATPAQEGRRRCLAQTWAC